MHTCFELRESPLSCDVETLGGLLFLLAQLQVDLVLARCHSRSWHLQSLAVAVALILAVHKHIGSQPGGDVAAARDAHVEWYVCVWDGNKGFHSAVSEAVPVLFQLGVSWAQLDGAGDLLEGRHCDGSVDGKLEMDAAWSCGV